MEEEIVAHMEQVKQHEEDTIWKDASSQTSLISALPVGAVDEEENIPLGRDININNNNDDNDDDDDATVGRTPTPAPFSREYARSMIRALQTDISTKKLRHRMGALQNRDAALRRREERNAMKFRHDTEIALEQEKQRSMLYSIEGLRAKINHAETIMLGNKANRLL